MFFIFFLYLFFSFIFKIFIVGQNPRSVKERIENGHYYAKDILNGVGGYFPYTLKEIFPANQEDTVHFNDIKNALLKD